MFIRMRITGLLIPIILVGIAVSVAHAGPRDNPPPLAGWTHTRDLNDDSPQKHGIILEGVDVARSSPVVGEIDGNAANGLEAAVGGKDGMLYVYGSTGKLLWKKNALPEPACSPVNDSNLRSGPTIADLTGDGTFEVLIGYGGTSSSDCDGGVAAYRGSDGSLIWRFSTEDWARDNDHYSDRLGYGVISTPAAADTDGDGTMEIGFGSLDHHIFLLNADGSVRWYYNAADSIWSSAAFVNVDADEALEMVIGSDIRGTKSLGTEDGGYVYAFDTQPVSGRVDFQDPDNDIIVWQTAFDQAIYSSPAIGDVLPDNPGDEVVIGASCFYPTDSDDKRGKWIKILSLTTGTVLQTLNAPSCVQSSAALGDIDDDGLLEIVTIANGRGSPAVKPTFPSRIVAWDPTNPTRKWQFAPGDPNSGSNDTYGGDLQSPVIADLDGNGSLEVIYANFWSVGVLNGKDGTPLTCQDPDCGDQLSLFAWKTVKATPAVGDVDKDGDLEVFMGGGHVWNSDQGMFYAWTDFAGLLNSPAGSQPAYATPWAMFRGDAQRTGVFATIESRTLQASLTTIGSLLMPSGPYQSRSYDVTIGADDGELLNWTVLAEDDPQNIVQLDRTAGSSDEPLTVTISVPSGLAPGSYTASVQIGEQTTAIQQQTEPLTITINAVVVTQIETTFLPVIQR